MRGDFVATEKQVNYYKALCELLGQEPDENFENLSVAEASDAISELKGMLCHLERGQVL